MRSGHRPSKGESNLRLVAALDVAKREMLDLCFGKKLLVLIILVGLLGALVLSAQLAAFREKAEHAEAILGLFRGAEVARAPYSDLKISAISLPTPPELFNVGILSELPIYFELSRLNFADPIAQRLVDVPFLSRLFPSDLRLVFQFVFPLIALLLGFSTVSLEKERGTLSLLLANPVPKVMLIIGKICAGALALIVLLVEIHLLVGLGVLLSGIAIGDGFFLFLGLHLVVAFFWSFFFFLLAAWVSTVTLSSVQSVVILLFLWLLLIIVVPSLIGTLAAHYSNAPPDHEVFEGLKPNYRALLEATERLLLGMGFQFAESISRYQELEPTGARFALALDSATTDTRLVLHSQGLVRLKTENREVMDKVTERLPQYIRKQSEIVAEIERQRLAKFSQIVEDERTVGRLSLLSPRNCFDAVTSRLAGTDLARYRDLVIDINRRQEEFFDQLGSPRGLYSERFFTVAETSDRTAEPVVWVFRTELATPLPIPIAESAYLLLINVLMTTFLMYRFEGIDPC